MRAAYLKYIAALLLVGSNGIISSYIRLDSYEIVFLRTFIGSIFLTSFFFLSGGRPRGLKNKKDLAYLIAAGMAMGGNWMFLYEAYARVGVSVATLANYCGPVIVVALSPLLLRERLTVLKCAVFAVVLAGMFLVNGNALLTEGFSWGLACGLMAALMYAFMVIFNKKAAGIAGLENAAFQLLFSFLTVAAFMFAKRGFYFPPVTNLAPVLFLGVINTAVGCYLYFSAIPCLPAGIVAICGYLEPISALALSALFLSERLAPPQMAGAFLIIGGAALYSAISMYKRKEDITAHNRQDDLR
ncbi:MAG: DMT family transporter [Synergistaceae bacterium]|nr:DMT family transporter [Synergistaceae bacterium]